MRSVVIAVTPRTEQRSSSSAQVSMNEPMQTIESEVGNISSSVPSGTPSPSAAPVERPAEPLRPAYLPPSEDVSGSVVMRDSRHIWDAADFFNAQMVSMRKRAPPAVEDQRVVDQHS